MKIIPEEKHPGMYRLQWDAGDISVGTTDPKPYAPGGHYGFYNWTRAKEISKRIDIETYEREVTYNNPLGRH